MPEGKYTIAMQDKQARLRMSVLEEKLNVLATDLSNVATTLSALVNNMQSLQFSDPAGGSCRKCQRYINYQYKESNATCPDEDCPSGLSELSHAPDS